jgi:hypothetical protein
MSVNHNCSELFFLRAHILAEESDAAPIKSGRPITQKFASRLRCLENSPYTSWNETIVKLNSISEFTLEEYTVAHYPGWQCLENIRVENGSVFF